MKLGNGVAWFNERGLGTQAFVRSSMARFLTNVSSSGVIHSRLHALPAYLLLLHLLSAFVLYCAVLCLRVIPLPCPCPLAI